MPRKGYRSISLKEGLFEKLKEEADKRKTTIPKLIASFIIPKKSRKSVKKKPKGVQKKSVKKPKAGKPECFGRDYPICTKKNVCPFKGECFIEYIKG